MLYLVNYIIIHYIIYNIVIYLHFMFVSQCDLECKYSCEKHILVPIVPIRLVPSAISYLQYF